MSTKIQKLTPITSPDPSLVLDLDFDTISGNTIRDRSRYNNHVTIYGATPDSEHGKGLLDFDGTDDYINCGNGTQLQTMTEFTLIATLKFKDLTGTQILIDKNIKKYFYADNSHINGTIYYSTTNPHSKSSTTIPLNKFTHLTILFSEKGSKKTKYFINTTEVNYSIQDTAEGTITSDATANLTIAARQGTSLFANIMIKQFKIFNRKLTNQEIKKNYLQTTR